MKRQLKNSIEKQIDCCSWILILIFFLGCERYLILLPETGKRHRMRDWGTSMQFLHSARTEQMDEYNPITSLSNLFFFFSSHFVLWRNASNLFNFSYLTSHLSLSSSSRFLVTGTVILSNCSLKIISY